MRPKSPSIGLSHSELARGAFVTRQSMNVLLQASERDGYVERPVEARLGGVSPMQLTARGRQSLQTSTAVICSAEIWTVSGMTPEKQSTARRTLDSMIQSSLRDVRRDSLGWREPDWVPWNGRLICRARLAALTEVVPRCP